MTVQRVATWYSIFLPAHYVALLLGQCETSCGRLYQPEHSLSNGQLFSAETCSLSQPLLPPNIAWSEITIDFIEGFAFVYGANLILVVVNRLKEYAHFLPLRHPFTNISVVKVYVHNVVKLRGVPRQ
jgi:hypothetical protein